MDQWEFAVMWAPIKGERSHPDVSIIATWKDKDGNTTMNNLDTMGNAGWELVSVVPITDTIGSTRDLVWAFKRPRQPQNSGSK